MNNARRTFRIFLAIQACAFVIVAFVLDDSSVLRAIMPAQAVLVGICLAVGPIEHASRVVGGIIVAALFVIVLTCLALGLSIGGLFGRNGYGWQFLMLTVRALFVGGFYWRSFLRSGYILSTSGERLGGHLLRFRLHHFLALTSLAALYFVVTGNLGGGPFYDVLLVAYAILLGFAYAIMSLLASLSVLEPRHSPSKVLAYLLGILSFSLAIAAHAYQSTGGWSSARFTWLETMVEVAWICGSLIAMRLVGFQISKQPASSLATDTTPLILLKRSLRFSLRTFFVALTLISIWLGWNVSIVRKRDHLREMIQGRPGTSGLMGIVTHADGHAAAPRRIKERIGPLIREAFDIRDGGGHTIVPKDYDNLSLIRRWLGDERVFLILLDESVDIRQFEAAFPEAMIVVRERSNR
jgi:hypothetical protein